MYVVGTHPYNLQKGPPLDPNISFIEYPPLLQWPPSNTEFYWRTKGSLPSLHKINDDGQPPFLREKIRLGEAEFFRKGGILQLRSLVERVIYFANNFYILIALFRGIRIGKSRQKNFNFKPIKNCIFFYSSCYYIIVDCPA